MSEINADFEQQIHDDLNDHPDFFARHLSLLDKMQIPHQRKGMISLVEAQLGRQREKIATLEQQLYQISNTVQQNEKLFFSLLPLQKALLQADNFTEANQNLNQWAKTLALKSAKILLLKDTWTEQNDIEAPYWIDRKAF